METHVIVYWPDPTNPNSYLVSLNRYSRAEAEKELETIRSGSTIPNQYDIRKLKF